MAGSKQFDFKTLEILGMLFWGLVEDEVVGMSYEAAKLLKQSMEEGHRQLQTLNQNFSPVERSEQAFKLNPMVGQMMGQLDQLIEQLRQRNQTTEDLQARMTRLEQKLTEQAETRHNSIDDQSTSRLPFQSSPVGQPAVVEPETRLAAIEDSLGSVELLAGELGQRGQDLEALENRLVRLETMLDTLSAVPELIGQQSQIVSSLEARLARLEAEQAPMDEATIESTMQMIEGDRVI